MVKELGKRLKGYQATVHVDFDEVGRKLVFKYENGRNKGRFELYELPHMFDAVQHSIPYARFDNSVTVIDQYKGAM
jgi:hypothetical protein